MVFARYASFPLEPDPTLPTPLWDHWMPHLEQFQGWVIQMGRSPATARAYGSALGVLFRGAREEGYPTLADAFSRWRTTPPMRRLAGMALRRFDLFLREYHSEAPSLSFVPRHLPPASKPKPDPLPFSILLRLLSVSRRRLTAPAGRSFRAWVLLSWETGIRRSEGANLAWNDIDFSENPAIRVIGKGGREREIPISRRLADALKVLRISSPTWPWTGKKGRRLGGHDLARMLRECSAAAKQKGVRIHRVRHSRLTLLAAQDGVDALTFCAVSGHADIRMAQHYVLPNAAKIRRAMEASRRRPAL